jgi:arylsulfatase A-like enzyme
MSTLRSFSLLILTFLVLANPVEQLQAQPSSERPNIIFVFTDDHATHALSAYGSEINETPNLDRLADEGTLFRNAFVTNSICAPSRAVILTGKHSHMNGVVQNGITFDGSQQTFPKLLREAGYQTAIVGKWHLSSDPTGFDYWEVLPGQGDYYNPDFRTEDGRTNYTGYVTDIITDRALNWLQNTRDPDEPFMLMYQHKAPHRGWRPGPDHLTTYDDVDMPTADHLFDDYAGRTTAAKWATMTIADHLNRSDLKLDTPTNLTDEQREQWNAAYGPKNEAYRQADLTEKERTRWKYQRYVKDYLRTIASVDDNMGRLLDYLDVSGLAENTVVIYSSDQGFYLGDHGWFDKRWMYEESFKTPLLVRWPGVTEPGSERTELVQNLDFAQTFLDIAGAEMPDDMQGRSLVPLLRDQNTSWRDAVYYHYYEFPGWHDVRRHYGVRTERYKLIHYYGIDEWELFDLQEDPEEVRSVYDDPAYANTVARLKDELNDLQDQYRVDQYDESPAPPDQRTVRLQRILYYDPIQLENSQLRDFSGHDHHGSLEHLTSATVEEEALRFDGNGHVELTPDVKNLNPTYRPLIIGGWCRPDAGNGVIAAHGNAQFGYSLYLEDGYPKFSVGRRARPPASATANEPVGTGEWVHIAGAVDENGNLRVLVNGEVAGNGHGGVVTQQPGDAFAIGADLSATVGDYDSSMRYEGLLRDFRLYWGKLGEVALRHWTSR